MRNQNVCAEIRAIKTYKIAKELVCEECIKLGSRWVHLRTCQTCGRTLCCDSSPNQHMSRHFAATNHPVVISSEPGERWVYCYIHDQTARY